MGAPSSNPADIPTPADPLAPTQRFTSRVRDYAAHRPAYPAECLRAITAGLPASPIAADIGAGTGIFAHRLAAAGLTVHAIEPNAAMAGAATPHPNIHWHSATGEATGLPDASVHLITCAQAFHWLDPAKALTEFARIAKAEARLAIVWNTIDHEDDASRAYRALLDHHAIEPPKSPHASQAIESATRAINDHPAFAPAQVLHFAYHQPLTREALLGRAFSSSYVPRHDTDAAKPFTQALNHLFDAHQHASVFTLRYQTLAFLSSRLP